MTRFAKTSHIHIIALIRAYLEIYAKCCIRTKENLKSLFDKKLMSTKQGKAVTVASQKMAYHLKKIKPQPNGVPKG